MATVHPELVVAAVVAMLVFITIVLRYELELATFVAAILAVSVMSVGFLLAVALNHFAGLSMATTAIALGFGVFLLALVYEAVA